MVLAYAGRLPGAETFPSDNVDFVREQVGRLLANLRPRVVVGSAAAGADLLVLEAALKKTAASASVVLAGSRSEFRETSVEGRGVEWERLYDTLLRNDRIELSEVPRSHGTGSSYDAVTELIASEASNRAGPDEPVVALNISAARDGSDHSADLALQHEVQNRVVLRIDPTRYESDAPMGFVAMPFGVRRDLDRGWMSYDADETYKRIILPALLDAGYRPVRADAEGLLEIIDATMLRAIIRADVLVADLATLNANVMWEVGARHAWRRAGTILIRPSGSDGTPPFDVSHARVHEYGREESNVNDHDSVAGIRLLQGLLAAVDEERTDSPIFFALPKLPEARLSAAELEENAPATASRYFEEVSLATDLVDGERLRAIHAQVEGDRTVPGSVRRAVSEQVSLALISLGLPDAALPLIGPLAEQDVAMERTRLQQQYAHALIRSHDPALRAERLDQATRRLGALIKRGQPSGETYGLLGSAEKAQLEMALAEGRGVDSALSSAIHAYLEGFRLEPTDYYPGIVSIALLRLRGQRLKPNGEDLRRTRELIPVVRFAAARLESGGDPWVKATLAELELHTYLLDGGREALDQASHRYADVAEKSDRRHRLSIARQLALLRDAGDPAEVIEPILALFGT